MFSKSNNLFIYIMDDKELLKLTPGELVDLGICPTCFNRKHNGALYGDNSDKLIYEDKDIEASNYKNHKCILSATESYEIKQLKSKILFQDKNGTYIRCYERILV